MEMTVIAGMAALAVLLGFILYFAESQAKRAADAMPRLRACPVCGKELKIGENILAERTGVVKDSRERIIIKGCPYCLNKK